MAKNYDNLEVVLDSYAKTTAKYGSTGSNYPILETFMLNGNINVFTRDGGAREAVAGLNLVDTIREMQQFIVDSALDIVVSGYYVTDNKIINKIVEETIDDFLNQRFDPEKLRDVINKAVSQSIGTKDFQNILDGNIKSLELLPNVDCVNEVASRLDGYSLMIGPHKGEQISYFSKL